MKYLKDTVIPRMLTDSNFSLSPSQNIFLDAEQAVAVTQAVEERRRIGMGVLLAG